MKAAQRVLAAAGLLLAAAGSCRATASDGKPGSPPRAAMVTIAEAVSHSDPQQNGDYWTPQRMRQAKPFPMPTRDGPPPPPQQTPPAPYPGRPSSSPPGAGGPPR